MSDAMLASLIGFGLGLGILGFVIALWLMWRKPWKWLEDGVIEIDGKIRNLREDLNLHIASDVKVVTCESCGCLVDGKLAMHGEDEIRYLAGIRNYLFGISGKCVEKEIYTPHYCKRCWGALQKKGKVKRKEGATDVPL